MGVEGNGHGPALRSYTGLCLEELGKTTNSFIVRSLALMAVTLKYTVFCDLTPCRLIQFHRRLWKIILPRFSGQERKFTPKLEAERASETSIRLSGATSLKAVFHCRCLIF
jgi:hypothetical protein